MILTLEDIGKVFKLKPKRYFWCIDIQESIQFKDEPKYVVFNQMASSISVYFGNIVESNLYGALKKCEIEFGSLDIEEEEIYDNVETFNNTKSLILQFYQMPTSLNNV